MLSLISFISMYVAPIYLFSYLMYVYIYLLSISYVYLLSVSFISM